MRLTEQLAANETAQVAVIGMGYVGLPVALGLVESGIKAIGLDIDPDKVKSLRAGQSYIKHIPSGQIASAIENETLVASTDFSLVSQCHAIVICVPTPLTRHREPDLSYVVDTIDSILPFLKSGQTVSLESTTYPGTTEEILRPKIESAGFTVGENLFLVYSPEREDPGNKQFSRRAIPKVVGGSTPECLREGLALYGQICDQCVPVSSTQVAEFSKLLENIHRAVNIGLVNEMKMVADRMGVDIWEVISAAKTKPFGFTPFYPGPGLGGHCIPIDPFYLTWKAKEFDLHTRFIELAGEINTGMPRYVVQRVIETLNGLGKALATSRVLVLGLAYKPNVDDLRESPSFHIMEILDSYGCHVSYHDPHIPVIPPTREHAKWAGLESLPWNEANFSSQDCVIISTAHEAYDLEELVKWAPRIIDTRNALAGIETGQGQVTKA
ncbi:MAG: nucleotide sugar dehydrogenase [Verrucomicrobiae bacterium]|nr:nucleotide sugar dehydrogenase [Verrucomicrobiae bacterium]